MPQIKVRDAKLSDSFELIKLLIPDLENKTKISLKEGKYYKKWYLTFKEMLKSKTVEIFVAEKNKKLVGVATVYILPRLELAGHYAVAEDVHIKESERGKGYGTLVFNALIKYLNGRGIKYVSAVVDKDNKIGRKFYEKLGFSNDTFGMRVDLN